MTDQMQITIPEVHSFKNIEDRAKKRTLQHKPRAALVAADNSLMMSPFYRAYELGLIEPVVFGDKKLFQKNAGSNSDCSKIRFVENIPPDDSVARAMAMVAEGEIDLIVKGMLAPDKFLKLLFDSQTGFVKKRKIVSHVAAMEPVDYGKLLFLTDAAVSVKNDLKSQISLIQNLVLVLNKMGIDNPRIAILAAVEVVYPQMNVTINGATLSKMAERGQIKGTSVDGPLSFDVAVDMEAAYGKGIKNSPVAGQADALVAPTIETANGIYKAMSMYGKGELGGVVVGGAVPVVVPAFIDSEKSRFNSILMGVLAASTS